MSGITIRAEKLGKLYTLGKSRAHRYRTLGDALAEAAAWLWRRNGASPARERIWALRDASFEIARGEVVGVIGRNGAGKTTLLKILSRITEPTEGEAEIRGRVGSLLEVGTGFHPDLTGRENVYLNGAILGMKRAEIDRRFDEIVAFAEVEKFLDTAVKHYSSGMHLRLAFAVAAHLDPEILLVDEVLAVGDAVFQKKCLGKMGEVAGEGRTVLFVSHNMAAVRSLCGRVIRLDGGRITADSTEVDEVAREYLSAGVERCVDREWPDRETAPGNERIRLRRARLEPGNIAVSTPFQIELEYWNRKPGTRVGLSLFVYNQEGVCIFNTTTAREPCWHGRPHPEGLFRSACRVPGNLLNAGTYTVMVKFYQGGAKGVLYQQADLLQFEVQDIVEDRGEWFGRWPGAVRPDLRWTTAAVTEPWN
jgi:lipopolysaccharide transport system ATP-binding protein